MTNTYQYREGSKLESAREIYLAFKKEHTRKEIIVLFMEDLEMSLAGASSFFHKVKDSDGALKPKTKLKQAEEIFIISTENKLNRKETLKALEDTLHMTESGASTYYYKVKKNLGV